MKQLHFEIYRDASREFRWRMVASNGRTVADSGEGYKRRSGCLKGIAAVHRSGTAKIVDLTKQK